MTVVGNDWDEILEEEYGKEYFTRLMKEVDEEYAKGVVYPPRPLVYSAMARVPYDKVRVVILGQDPYHGEGQANGMAFAVGKGVPLPPSLVNIFKEIEAETGVEPNGSTLTGWASQGVLLLNTVLTVREHSPQSHAELGWQTFTDAVIASLARREEPMVFMLWGANALRKNRLFRRATSCSKAFTRARFRRIAGFRMRAFRKSERIPRFARAPADRLGVCGRRRQSRILQAVRRHNRTDLRSLPLWAGALQASRR